MNKEILFLNFQQSATFTLPYFPGIIHSKKIDPLDKCWVQIKRSQQVEILINVPQQQLYFYLFYRLVTLERYIKRQNDQEECKKIGRHLKITWGGTHLYPFT